MSILAVAHSLSAAWLPPVMRTEDEESCHRPCLRKTPSNSGATSVFGIFSRRVNCFVGFRPWIALATGTAPPPALPTLDLVARPPSAPAMDLGCMDDTT
eukprot:7530430-Alexandrium_andersonii.AAC.1